MTTISKSYRLDTVINFTFDPKVNLTHWFDGFELRPRMEGIYPNLNTADELFEHLAFNALVNGVRDASELDGYADLSRGDFRVNVDYTQTDIEASD